MTTERVWALYYKGSGVQIPVNNPEEVIKSAENTITKGLKMNISLETQKLRTIETLELLHNKLLKHFDGKEWDLIDMEREFGEEEYKRFLTAWTINVVCGLKLKLFNNDDMNGHYFIELKTNNPNDLDNITFI